MKTAVIYGSTTDNTRTVAEKIAKKIPEATLLDVAKIGAADLNEYDNLILGTSTWGLGDLQDDWDSFLPELGKTDLSGKTIALFGLGDSSTYPDTFVDGMGIIYNKIKDKGAKIVGQTETADYSFDASVAVENDKFVGLPIDEDNESDMTDERIDKWINALNL